jgi:hypothetical protein
VKEHSSALARAVMVANAPNLCDDPDGSQFAATVRAAQIVAQYDHKAGRKSRRSGKELIDLLGIVRWRKYHVGEVARAYGMMRAHLDTDAEQRATAEKVRA